MEISVKEYKRCDVVKPVGRIDSSTAPEFEEALASITEAGRYRIIVDMADVNFVSSKGLWVLVNAQKKCKRYNRGEVVLSRVQDPIRDSLNLVGMGSYFDIKDDLTDAVGSF